MGNPRDHILHALYIGTPPITIPEAPCIEISKIFGKYAGNHQILFLIPYTVYIDKTVGPGCTARIGIDQYTGCETSFLTCTRVCICLCPETGTVLFLGRTMRSVLISAKDHS